MQKIILEITQQTLIAKIQQKIQQITLQKTVLTIPTRNK